MVPIDELTNDDLDVLPAGEMLRILSFNCVSFLYLRDFEGREHIFTKSKNEKVTWLINGSIWVVDPDLRFNKCQFGDWVWMFSITPVSNLS